MRQTNRVFRPALLGGLLAAALPGQGQDPGTEIQEIARRVDEQLREIDKLLLDSTKKPAAGQPQPKQLLQHTRDRSQEVEQSLDELIQKLTEMKNQSRSNQQDQQQQQQPQQPDQQDQQGGGRRPQNRQEGANPDFMQQPRPGEQPQQGKQPGQPQPPPGKPDGPEPNPDGGQNKHDNQQPDQATGPGKRGEGEAEWGQLQPYVNFLRNRGSMPKVPEKFRTFWEAYLRSQRDKKE